MTQIQQDRARDWVVLRCVLGIAACQVVVVMGWISLGPDIDAARYASVKTVLSRAPATSAEQADQLLASHALINASKSAEILSWLLLFGSLVSLALCCFLVAHAMARSRRAPLGR